ncbi:MAG: DsrE family protein [Rhodobacteraceae bacterium]|nr:DsrE family protein [Paracoccaceae bacterium]MCW9044433.1 DsrE family protein [Pseudopelagicola sp.]
MKKLLSALALSAMTAAGAASADDQKDLVTILTAPEPQTQLMSMVLTMQAAQQGAAAHILLCGPAADLALKDAPASATAGQPPKDMSPQGLMQMIMKQPGAKVEVCAIYLPGKGVGQDALLDGVGVAKPGEMAKAVLDADASMSF